MDFIWFQFPLRSAAVSYFAGSYKSASLLLFTLLLHISWVIFWEICLLKAIFKVGNRALHHHQPISGNDTACIHCYPPFQAFVQGRTEIFRPKVISFHIHVFHQERMCGQRHVYFPHDLTEYRPLSKEDIGVIFTSRFNVFYIVDQECMGWCSNWNIWQASYFVALHAAFICKKCTFL